MHSHECSLPDTSGVHHHSGVCKRLKSMALHRKLWGRVEFHDDDRITPRVLSLPVLAVLLPFLCLSLPFTPFLDFSLPFHCPFHCRQVLHTIACRSPRMGKLRVQSCKHVNDRAIYSVASACHRSRNAPHRVPLRTSPPSLAASPL